ncbi:MAG: Na(+)/H(+) antiporter subunit B [Rhodospirillales bacterium]
MKWRWHGEQDRREMERKEILRVITKLLIPMIMLFGLYVQFHGDFGPGGGFQAGVIFASAFIVYALVFGVDLSLKVITPAFRRWMLSCGLFLYAGVGVAGIFMGGRYLDYSVLADNPVIGQHMGILLIELGVGITVAGAMITIFNVFANQEHRGD